MESLNVLFMMLINVQVCEHSRGREESASRQVSRNSVSVSVVDKVNLVLYLSTSV